MELFAFFCWGRSNSSSWNFSLGRHKKFVTTRDTHTKNKIKMAQTLSEYFFLNHRGEEEAHVWYFFLSSKSLLVSWLKLINDGVFGFYFSFSSPSNEDSSCNDSASAPALPDWTEPARFLLIKRVGRPPMPRLRWCFSHDDEFASPLFLFNFDISRGLLYT